LNDLGNLMLALVILWAYLSFSQLLIIWMGNISPDSPWYIRRGFSGDPAAPHGWRNVAAILLIFGFFVPFFVLLIKSNKRDIRIITLVAVLVLFMRVIDAFWWNGPTSLDDWRPGHLDGFLTPRTPNWMDLVTPIALFGIFMTFMLWLLKGRPLLARVEEGPDLDHPEATPHHGAPAHGGSH